MSKAINDRKYIVIGILVVIITALLYWVLFKDSESITKKSTDDKVEIEYTKDKSNEQLLIVSTVKLDQVIASNKTIKYTVNIYDQNDKLINTYSNDTSMFNLNSNKVIKLGLYALMDSEQLDNIGNIKATYKIVSKRNIKQVDYEQLNLTKFMPEYPSNMYRISLTLADYYKQYGGIAVLNYENDKQLMRYLSYLNSINFIGITSTEDLTTKDGNQLISIDIYQSIALLK